MKKFYDELLPKRLQKIVKPFGGTVERLRLEHPAQPWTGTDTEHAPAWIVRLTPELKDRILRYGLPLMGVAGAVETSNQKEPE